jgi:hypothetical protein
MLEPFGIKASTAIAGFFGSVAALSYLRPTDVWNALAIIACGLFGAMYWTPVASHYLGLHESLEHPAAFTIGVVSMTLVSALLSFAEYLRANPGAIISWFRRGG